VMAVGPNGYGDATFRRYDDGRVVVQKADDVIGVSLELLASAAEGLLWVDRDGLLWLAGDYRYRYRPVRFEPLFGDLPEDAAVEGVSILICERVPYYG
jgi:hypothetical protein